MKPQFAPIRFQVTGNRNPITIDRCEGDRLPKQPHMWAVRDSFGQILAKDGEFEWEPQPSSRDDEFYARCRFDTYEEAEQAAIAKAVAMRLRLLVSAE